MSFKRFVCFAILLISCFSCVVNSEMNKEMSDKKIYYANFSGYSIPLKLVEEISEEDALSKPAYYIGYFQNNRLVRVEKFFNGDLFFQHDYVYQEDGSIKESKVINPDGEEKINTFDK